jgi:hypothetical protein
VALTANEDILIGGPFTAVGGVERRGIAKLLGEMQCQMSMSRLSPNGFQSSAWTAPGKSYVLEWSNSLDNQVWTALPKVIGDGTVKDFLDPSIPESQRFYRLRIE